MPATSSDTGLEYFGSLAGMKGATRLKILEHLNAVHGDVMHPSLDGQVLSYEIRGADKISNALKKMEIMEAEIEELYKKAKARTATNFSSFYTWSLYSKWAIINFILVPSILSQDPVLAASFAVLFNAVISPLYYLRYKYQKKRIDSSFASFRQFLKLIIEKPDPDQIAINSASMTLPANFHRYLFSDQQLAGAEEIRNQAVNLWGGSFIKFAAEWWVKGASTRTILADAALNAGDISRGIFIDRIAFYDSERNEPVWLFIYRSNRSGRSGSTPIFGKAPQIRWDSEPAFTFSGSD